MTEKTKVLWESSLDRALERAQKEEKPLLVDFFKDG